MAASCIFCKIIAGSIPSHKVHGVHRALLSQRSRSDPASRSQHSQLFVFSCVARRQVYEDEAVLAFLDINPFTRGHTVVVPKAHGERLSEFTPEQTAALFAALPKVAAAVTEEARTPSYNLIINNGPPAGQEVSRPHALPVLIGPIPSAHSTGPLTRAHLTCPRARCCFPVQVPHSHWHVIPRTEGDALRGMYRGAKTTPIKEMYSDPADFAAKVKARTAGGGASGATATSSSSSSGGGSGASGDSGAETAAAGTAASAGGDAKA